MPNNKTPTLRIVGRRTNKPVSKDPTPEEKLKLESESYAEGLVVGYSQGLQILKAYDHACKQAGANCGTAKSPLEIEKTQGILQGLLSAFAEYGDK